MSEQDPVPEDRLRALAKAGARQQHADYLAHPGEHIVGEPKKHVGLFTTCPNPDCVLTRSAPPVARGGEPPAWQVVQAKLCALVEQLDGVGTELGDEASWESNNGYAARGHCYLKFANELHRIQTELAAALAAELAAWEPIETAPKDGKQIIVWDASPNGGVAVAHRSANGGKWLNPGCFPLRPTHWMPLPPAPRAAGEPT